MCCRRGRCRTRRAESGMDWRWWRNKENKLKEAPFAGPRTWLCVKYSGFLKLERLRRAQSELHITATSGMLRASKITYFDIGENVK